jgi:hypothetical protein
VTGYTGGGDYWIVKLGDSVAADTITKTAVSPVNNAIIISIAPNPATSRLTITAHDKINLVIISNPVGQIVYKREYNEEKAQVDVSNLPAGVYFVRINGTEIRKFVKE